MGAASVRAGSSAARMWGQATGSGRTTMCAKPPQGAGRTGTWTTVGMRGRVGWAKATAIGTVSVRAGSSAAGMSGQATGSRRTTMCAKPPPGAGRTGTWTTVGMRGRVGWAKAIAMGTVSVRVGSSAARMWGPPTGSRRTTMCVKPPQVGGRTDTWTTVGSMGRVVRAKAIAIVPANVRAGSSAAGMSGPPTGSRRPTMCASSAAGRRKRGSLGRGPRVCRKRDVCSNWPWWATLMPW